MKKLILLIIVALCLITTATAIDNLGYFKYGECIDLIQICSNCTYNDITSVRFPNSTIALENVSMQQNGVEYNYTLCNTNATGEYTVNGKGDENGIVSVWAYKFNVTPNGQEVTTGKILSLLIILAIILIVFIILCFAFANAQNDWLKLALFGICYLALIYLFHFSSIISREYLNQATISDYLQLFVNVLWILVIPLCLYLICVIAVSSKEYFGQMKINKLEGSEQGAKFKLKWQIF